MSGLIARWYDSSRPCASLSLSAMDSRSPRIALRSEAVAESTRIPRSWHLRPGRAPDQPVSRRLANRELPYRRRWGTADNDLEKASRQPAGEEYDLGTA